MLHSLIYNPIVDSYAHKLFCSAHHATGIWWIRANGCNLATQQLPTLLGVACSIPLHPVLHVIGSHSAKFATGLPIEPTTPNISFRDHWRVAQQRWIRLHSSFNSVEATQAHYIWSPWRSISTRHSARLALVRFLFELRHRKLSKQSYYYNGWASSASW